MQSIPAPGGSPDSPLQLLVANLDYSDYLGRIAIAAAPSRPGTLYATVEAKKTALYRSDDRGESWTWVGDASAVTGRPFYFSRLVMDPKNADRVYKPGFSAAVSDHDSLRAALDAIVTSRTNVAVVVDDDGRHLGILTLEKVTREIVS